MILKNSHHNEGAGAGVARTIMSQFLSLGFHIPFDVQDFMLNSKDKNPTIE